MSAKLISKKHFLIVAGVLLATATTVSLAVFSRPDLESGLKSVFSHAIIGSDGKAMTAQRLMAMLDARSPGERTTAELAATKRKAAAERKLVANAVPTQRALGKVIQSKNVPPQQFFNAITPAPVAVTVPQGFAQVPLGELLAAGPAAFAPAVGGLLIPPVGGGGGGGGGSGTPGSPVTPGNPAAPVVVVTPAVPEPATWMMMVFGFGAIGFAMRGRGAVAVAMPAKA